MEPQAAEERADVFMNLLDDYILARISAGQHPGDWYSEQSAASAKDALRTELQSLLESIQPKAGA